MGRGKKIALCVLGGILAIPLALTAVGIFLPSGHKAVVRVTILRPPPEVFATITDFEKLPTWAPDVEKAEVVQSFHSFHRRWLLSGRHGDLVLEQVELRPPSRHVCRIVNEGSFGGTWTYDIAPVAEGSTVTITEDGQVYNPIFRPLARFVFGYTSTQEAYLRALGKKLGMKGEPEVVARGY